MNIAVLCGGLGSERDVSITSGTRVARALRLRGHNVVLLDLYLGYEGSYNSPAELYLRNDEVDEGAVGEKTPDLEAVKAMRKQPGESLMGDNVLEICSAADVTFLALHGDEGENGKLQAAFDIAGIKYTGSGYLGSAIAMHKGLTKRLFAIDGIKSPAGEVLDADGPRECSVGFPCVVKPCSGGSSVGTSIVHNVNDFKSALELAFLHERQVLVESYIKGRELTIGVMDGKAMPIIEIIPKTGFYDYKNKYQAGLTIELCPAPVDDETRQRVERLAEKVGQTLMIDAYYRVDLIMDEDGELYCLEANTLPGMTPISLIPQMGAAMGIGYGEICEKIIEVSLKKYGKQ